MSLRSGTRMARPQAIGEICLRLNLITQEQLDQALEKQKQLKTQEALGDVLVNMGLICEKDRVRCLGEQWGVPFVDLTEVEPEPDALKMVSQELARRQKVMPIARRNACMRCPLSPLSARPVNRSSWDC